MDAVTVNPQATTPYWQHYGMHKDPFQLDETADPYPVPHQQTLIETLLHMSLYDNLLISVTGEMHTGKSTFLRQLHAAGLDRLEVVRCTADIEFKPAILYQELTQGLAVHASATHDDAPCYDDLLSQLAAAERNVLVLIDDAQLLPKTTLASILSIVAQQHHDQANCHFILAGEPELATKLTQLAQNYAIEYQNEVLQPLKFVELERFLRYALATAGMRGHFPFTNEDIEFIARMSQGYLGRTAQVARQVLLNKQQPSSSVNAWLRLWAKHQRAVSLASVLVMSGFIILITNFSRDVTVPTSPEPRRAAAPKVLHHETAQRLSQLGRDYFDSESLGPKPQTIKPVDFQPFPQPVAAPRSSKLYIATKPYEVRYHAADFTQHVVIKKIIKPHHPVPRKLADPPAIPQQVTAPVVNFRPQQAAARRAVLQSHPNEEKVVLDKVLVLPKLHERRAPAHSFATGQAAQYSLAERVILQTPASMYSLQILAARHEAAILAFIKRHRLQGKAIHYQTLRAGKPWYVLLYGRYKTRSEASNALATLPSALRQQKPWPRAMANVQQAIREKRQQ